jgi:hypothetical protein
MARTKGVKDLKPRVRRTRAQIERDKKAAAIERRGIHNGGDEEEEQALTAFAAAFATVGAEPRHGEYGAGASPSPSKRPKLDHHQQQQQQQQQQAPGKIDGDMMDPAGGNRSDRHRPFPSAGKAMVRFLDAVRRQVSKEMNKQRVTPKKVKNGEKPTAGTSAGQRQQRQPERWLIPCLASNNFWISRHMAKFMCQKLGIDYENPGYYKDIKLWIPEVQWGPQFQPRCLKCGKAETLGNEGMDKCRLVMGLDMNYFIMTRRWKCHECKSAFSAADAKCREQLPRAKSLEFPAFLTHTSAVDEKVLSLIHTMCQPVAKSGINNNNLGKVARLLQELHMKEYERLRILDAYDERQQLLLDPSYTPIPFSSFQDPAGYAGKLISMNYIMQISRRDKGSGAAAAKAGGEKGGGGGGVPGVQQQLIMYNEQLQHEPAAQQHVYVEDNDDDDNEITQKVAHLVDGDVVDRAGPAADKNVYAMSGDDDRLLASIIDHEQQQVQVDVATAASNHRGNDASTGVSAGTSNAPAVEVAGAAEEEPGSQHAHEIDTTGDKQKETPPPPAASLPARHIPPPAFGTQPRQAAPNPPREMFAVPFPLAPTVPALLQEGTSYVPPIFLRLPGQRGPDKKGTKRKARECTVCRRSDCRGAKNRVWKGESRECEFTHTASASAGTPATIS